jgi:hypothetical protein
MKIKITLARTKLLFNKAFSGQLCIDFPIYAVPKSGLIALYYCISASNQILTLKELKDVALKQRVVVFDGVYESGITEQRIKDYVGEKAAENLKFVYLIDKRKEYQNDRIVWPWGDYEELVDDADDELRKEQKRLGIGIETTTGTAVKPDKFDDDYDDIMELKRERQIEVGTVTYKDEVDGFQFKRYFGLEFVEEILEECKELMNERNQKYGDSWRTLSIQSTANLIEMKMNRVARLGLDAKIKDELQDSINYAIFALYKLKQRDE